MSVSIWQLLIVIISLLPAIPFANGLKRAGYSRWWCLLALVPIINIIMLYVFAFSTWPERQRRHSSREYEGEQPEEITI